MNVPSGLENVLSINAQIMHGELCFTGTRVPLTVFLDNLAEGLSIEDFCRNYPSIKRDQIRAVIEWENDAIRLAAGMQLVS